MYYIAKAKNILFTLFCCCILLSNVAYAQDKSQTAPPPNLPSELFDNTPLTPTKVFDNLYCIGTKSVVAWALQTSDGIILIDSMWDNNDTQLIIDGMKKLGLNPQDLKYILISHGHGDHYGGAQYLKDKYNAKIFMSNTDFYYMNNTFDGVNGSRSPKCTVDEFLTDGQQITLGDTTVTVVSTPGHSPGCVSFIFPVKTQGKTYMAAQWGGTGIPKSMENKVQYKSSLEHFSQYCQDNNVVVETTAHLFADNGYAKLNNVVNSTFIENNPFYLGQKGIDNYLNNLSLEIDRAIANSIKKESKYLRLLYLSSPLYFMLQ